MEKNRNKSYIMVFFILSLFLFTSCLYGCIENEPKSIKIGFSGTLTGQFSDLGVDGRDGASLAVEIINQDGGINGKQIDLIIKNDEGDENISRKVDQELIDEGAIAIIGHMTSTLSEAVIDLINDEKIVLISPTASSEKLSRINDYFFRVAASTDQQAIAFARYIFSTRNISNVTGVYDLGNQVYTEEHWKGFQTEFTKLGGNATQSYYFNSSETNLQSFIGEINISESQAVLFIASAFDTALMVQYAKQIDMKTELFSSAWAQTAELMAKGGKSIEGLELVGAYNPNNTYPFYQDFLKNFTNRYNRNPGFAAGYAYETMLVLADALKRTNGLMIGLPQALTEIIELKGVYSDISINEYGDVIREIYIVRVENGQYNIVNISET